MDKKAPLAEKATKPSATYSNDEVATLMGISPETLKAIMKRDGFPAHTSAGFDKTEVDRYLDK